MDGKVHRADVSEWPVRTTAPHLADFLRYPTMPLSARATAGFLKRARQGSLRFPEGFLDAVDQHLKRMLMDSLAA
jgi:DNA (cytosine-5)-methyltransferase 1